MSKLPGNLYLNKNFH